MPKALRRGFDSLLLLLAWLLWKERNRHTFDAIASTTAQLMLKIKEEMGLWIGAGNKHLAALVHRQSAIQASVASQN